MQGGDGCGDSVDYIGAPEIVKEVTSKNDIVWAINAIDYIQSDSDSALA